MSGRRDAEDLVSVVVPVFNEAPNLPPLFEAVRTVLEGAGERFEVVFVDDGSTDASWACIAELAGAGACVRGIRFSRNFGHQAALLAGLEAARGRAVITMDADLQHPPALLPRLLECWRAGACLVLTRRADAASLPVFKRWTSAAFYRLFSFLSGMRLDPGMADFRLLDRRVVEALRRHGEQGLFLRGLVQTLGFPAAVVDYEPAERAAGTTKYSLGRMLRLAWSGILGFSLVPLRLASVTGLVTGGLSFVWLLYVLWVRLFTDRAVAGWASMTGIVALLFGILFLLLGIIGEYLGRILVEVRARPRYLVMDAVGD